MLHDNDLDVKFEWDWHKDSVNPSGLILRKIQEDKYLISTPKENTTINMNSLLYV
jgi:hypothetical protein